MNQQHHSIFIIEDQNLCYFPLFDKSLLKQQFRSVQIFCSAHDAIAKNKFSEAPPVVLVDLDFLKSTSEEVVKKLVLFWAQSKLLVYSSSEDDEEVVNAFKFGAAGYILKREATGTIFSNVSELLDGGVPISRTIARKIIHSFRIQHSVKDLDQLTSRERELLRLLAMGFLNKEIADRLHICLSTVKNHLQHMYPKLKVQNRSEAIIKYLKSTTLSF